DVGVQVQRAARLRIGGFPGLAPPPADLLRVCGRLAFPVLQAWVLARIVTLVVRVILAPVFLAATAGAVACIVEDGGVQRQDGIALPGVVQRLGQMDRCAAHCACPPLARSLYAARTTLSICPFRRL